MSMQFCHLEHSRRLWLWCLLMLVVVAFALYPATALAQDTPAQPGPDVPRAAPSKRLPVSLIALFHGSFCRSPGASAMFFPFNKR